MSAPHLQVGYVSRAHGLRGEVAVRTFDPASTALLDVERAFVRRKDGSSQELAIEAARTTSRDLLLGFAGIDTREAADALVGSTVFVFREDLPPPEEGEYFLGDLMGLQAFTESGEPLGSVEEIFDTGAVPNLVVRGNGNEWMLPFVDDFVPVVDLEGKRITVRLPEFTE